MLQSNNYPFDAHTPAEIAQIVQRAGQAKTGQAISITFVLAILAGAFIAMGAAFATTVTTGCAGVVPYGITKLLGGLVFCLGLILVVVAGAELFTGNNLIVMAWSSKLVSTREMLAHWIVVYVGNFVGAALTAVLFFVAGHADAAGGAVGDQVLAIASAKCSLGVTQAVAAGIGCNALVCLAVWLCMGARSVTDKVMAVIFPITAFVALDMQHCVANMYFVPIGMLVKASRKAAGYTEITAANFFAHNLLPVTIGNIIGGAVMVGLVYWFIYLRKSGSESA